MGLLLDRPVIYLGFALVGGGCREGRCLPRRAVAILASKQTRVTNSIRALRFARGEMTQAQLAERIGVTRQTIIAIEQGRYSPSLEMAFQIAPGVRSAARAGLPVPGQRRAGALIRRQNTSTYCSSTALLP
jgi:putative transcriptional regulator